MRLEQPDVDTDELTEIVELQTETETDMDEQFTATTIGIYKYPNERPNEDNPYIVVYDNRRHSINFGIEAERTRKAKLIFGLFQYLPCDKYSEVKPPDRFYQGISESTIPTGVALGGRESIAAYYKILFDTTDTINTRNKTAKILGVEPQTISNYWNRARWDGCIECLSENVHHDTLIINGDEVDITECNDCGYYFVTREDFTRSKHKHSQENCTDELTRAIGSINGDEYELWCCNACGFYTAEDMTSY